MVLVEVVSSRKLRKIADLTGFRCGSLPFTYLGVPLLKGRVKVCHFLPTTDKILAKLSSWKGYLLSMAGRLTIVKSTIYIMLSYTMAIYS